MTVAGTVSRQSLAPVCVRLWEVHHSIYTDDAECLQMTILCVTSLELQNSHSVKISEIH